MLAAAAGTYVATELVGRSDLLAQYWYGDLQRDGGTYSFFAYCETGLHNCSTGSYSEGITVPVGSFSPNAIGVYDLFGNAAELVENCRDIFESLPEMQPRFVCDPMGGSFASSYRYQLDVTPQSMALNSSERSIRNDLYTNNENSIGFRVVAEIERPGFWQSSSLLEDLCAKRADTVESGREHNAGTPIGTTIGTATVSPKR